MNAKSKVPVIPLARVGDRVRVSGNVMYGLVIAATRQWVIVINDEPRYLRENPKEMGVEHAVPVGSVIDVLPKATRRRLRAKA